jgi:two-component system CheB/CheR fusion protein
VLVNESLEILQFRGSTSPFLEPAPGEARLNLSRMAREGLMIEIGAAIRRAKKEGAAIRREGVRFNPIGHAQQLNLEVVPIGSGKDLNFLVLFESAERPPAAEGVSPKRIEKSVPEKKGEVEAGRSVRLQRELEATKEYLQAAIESQETTNEELRSAYEEIQSSNEELQSTNEELETAKEELQSTK